MAIASSAIAISLVHYNDKPRARTTYGTNITSAATEASSALIDTAYLAGAVKFRMLAICANIMSLLMLTGFQMPTPPSSGTCIVVFQSGTLQRPVLQGFDLESGAAILVDDRTGVSYLRTPTGETYQTRPGESGSLRVPDDRVVTIEQLLTSFPVLVQYALTKVDPEYKQTTRHPDGSMTITAQLVLGNLGLTARGYVPPGDVKRTEARYTFDPSGLLTSIQHGDHIRPVRYASAEHPVLAPMYPDESLGTTDFNFVSVETYMPGRPELFEQDAVIALFQQISQQRAEADRAAVSQILETSEGQTDHRDAQQSTNGLFGVSFNRLALIITGLIVISVGSLAWWKNRS